MSGYAFSDIQTRRDSPDRGGYRGGVVDLSQADSSLPTGMVGLLAGGQELLERAAEAVDRFGGERLANPEIQLLAPISILPRCSGSGRTTPPTPWRPAACPRERDRLRQVFHDHHGPDAPIVLPKISQKVDYEAELGVVIGAPGRNIPPNAPTSMWLAMCPFHDVSARDYQMRTSQWTLGKNFDTFSPMGPAW